jgi:uncharacterized Ntn-hydrolase superfamily protein
MTFSIVARCSRTGMLGVGTSSRALASGTAVPYVRSGVGAIASQAFTNPYLGIDGLTLLEQGLTAARALERVIESDWGRDLRQVAIVDRDGHTAAYTGAKCIPWAGQVEGGSYVCLGNILTGEEVVKAMALAFETSVDEELAERLLRALEAGQEAGGDRRGRQSAGIRVVHTEEYPYCELQVDDHPDPIAELRRLFTLFQREEPFRQMSPRRDDFTPQWEAAIRMHEMLKASLEEEAAVAKER